MASTWGAALATTEQSVLMGHSAGRGCKAQGNGPEGDGAHGHAGTARGAARRTRCFQEVGWCP